jgi:polyhydroxyalkanoate synthesis regulator phasin
MTASKSSPSGGSRASGAGSSAQSSTSTRRSGTRANSTGSSGDGGSGSGASHTGEGLVGLAEQLINRVINPLGLVMLTRERIQDTMDEAAARGRVTRSDANELAAELVRRGRQQTDELMGDLERLLGRGRDQLGSATRRTRLADGMDRLVRTADRARRTVGVGPSFPIIGYDELTAAQVHGRLDGLTPAELRKVRDYERRHANRKSVLDTIEKALR